MHDVPLKLESIRDDFRDKYWHHLRGRVCMGKAEAKGAAGVMGMRPFVKEVIGVDHAGRPVKRELRGKKCYLDARGSGTRGVHYWFTLRQGGCYLVQEQTSRTATRRRYVMVNGGAMHEISEAQAIAYVLSTRVVP